MCWKRGIGTPSAVCLCAKMFSHLLRFIIKEMLQFGYRMNRYDEKTKRSALTMFLDRVPSDKFDPKQVDDMIILGANINDESRDPRDEEDNEEKDKIWDNVLVRYIKVTPWYVCREPRAYRAVDYTLIY